MYFIKVKTDKHWHILTGHWKSLNISTGHQAMSSKKLSYVGWRLLHNRNSCSAWCSKKKKKINYRRVKTQKDYVSIDLYWSGFFVSILINNWLIFQNVRYLWEKRFYINTSLFLFALLGQFLLWKHFICYCIALNTYRGSHLIFRCS